MNFVVLFLWKNTCFKELADGRTFTLLDSALHGERGKSADRPKRANGPQGGRAP